MFDFIKNYLTKNKGKKEYEEKLHSFLSDNKLDDNEKEELKKIAKQYNLSEDELYWAHANACSIVFSNITSDKKITNEEKESLKVLTKYFNVNSDDFNYDQKTFNKYYTLGLLEKGILPEIKEHDIDIIFKKDEKLHWACPAYLKKYKRVTNRVNYGGLTSSIKIVKGLRYRAGSVRVATQTSEFLDTEDTGAFWLTNQRIGFKGSRKNITIPLKKVLSFELSSDGLRVSKEGKEIPYIFWLDDYDVPCSIVSRILNKE